MVWSATNPCPNADTPADAQNQQQMILAVDCLINQQRMRFGLLPYNVDPKLNEAAQGWADKLTQNDQYFHGNPAARWDAVGYDWQEGGENIATGQTTPRDVVSAWMASSDHCQNILDPTYRDMGTGESFGGTWPPMWVQDFGLVKSQNPPSWNYSIANSCPYSIPSSNPSSSGSGSGVPQTQCDPNSPWPSAPGCPVNPSAASTGSTTSTTSTTATTSTTSTLSAAPLRFSTRSARRSSS